MFLTLTEDTISDEAKMVQKAQRDKNAFAPLYEKYYEDIFKYLFRRVNDEFATADLTSQVFLKALLHIKKWKYEGLPFSAWLYRIALNESREYFRATKKLQYVVLSENAKATLANDVNDVELKEEKLVLTEQALYTLGKDDLQLVELRYYEQLPFRDIAYLLNISESNAKVRLYRILEKLKKIIEDEQV